MYRVLQYYLLHLINPIYRVSFNLKTITMKIKTTIVLMLISLAITSCGEKCYVCTSPTAMAATQDDYDKGYTPDKKEGCVGQEYMQGSDGIIHHKTQEEVNSEVATWEGEGYKCEWK